MPVKGFPYNAMASEPIEASCLTSPRLRIAVAEEPFCEHEGPGLRGGRKQEALAAKQIVLGLRSTHKNSFCKSTFRVQLLTSRTDASVPHSGFLFSQSL